MLGIFRSLRSICRPQDRLFLFLFIFTRHGRQSPGFVTTADFRSTSHTHSSAGRRPQQQAFNEPGPRPSFHRSKAPLASRFGSSAFTAALPAAAQICSRASSFWFQMLTRGGLRQHATTIVANNSQGSSKGRYVLIKVIKRPRKDIDVNATM